MTLRTDHNKLYQVWKEMRARCNRPTHHAYAYYGGRGISVHPIWDVFENFLAHMGDAPPGMTLDRLNNDGDYSPFNCAWRTRKDQMQNTRERCFRSETSSRNNPMRYIYQAPNGRWNLQITLCKGIRQTYTFDTLDKALEERANLEMEREMFHYKF